MRSSLKTLEDAAIRSEERFVQFLRFAKFVGSITLLVLSVVAWVGVTLLVRIDRISDSYQAADVQLLLRSTENKQEIYVVRESMKRVESDLGYIRKEIDRMSKND